MRNPEATFLFARHTKKQKKPGEGSEISGKFYEGITPEGEELVREKTRTAMLEVIENSEPGSVIVFAGKSDLIRTGSTSDVSVDELGKILADRNDEFVIMSKDDIDRAVEPAHESRRSMMSGIAAANPDKKVIMSYPLALKEFSLVQPDNGPRANTPDWKTGGKDEKFTPYLTELMRRANNEEAEAVSLWIESGGKFTMEDGTVVEGPDPTGTAKDYTTALMRLNKVTGELFPGRPRVVEATTHSWDVDVFIAYATHNGKLDRDAFEEIAKGDQETDPSIISEFEFPVIKLGKSGGTIDYRGKRYQINSPEFTFDNDKNDEE